MRISSSNAAGGANASVSVPSRDVQAAGSGTSGSGSRAIDRAELSDPGRRLSRGSAAGSEELSRDEERQVEAMERTDREVRAHEQAHVAAGGSLAGAVQFEYQTGPDGGRYAVSGEVSIRYAPSGDDPREAIRQAEQVRRAALAPADPSPTDRSVARKATAEIQSAHAELARPEDDPEGEAQAPDPGKAAAG